MELLIAALIYLNVITSAADFDPAMTQQYQDQYGDEIENAITSGGLTIEIDTF